MPTPTYTPLATLTVSGTSTTTVQIASIPATYRDLILVIAGSSSADAGLRVRFNNDTGSNYTYVYMQGASGGASSSSGTNTHIDSYITTAQCNTTHTIMDYSATDKHKTVLSVRQLGGSDVMRLAQRWANTSAINEIDIFFSGSQYFVAGTVISLYGVIA